MRIFIAGATGAVGKRLVPLLVRSGHQVVASTRSSSKVGGLRAAGAEPVVLDALDRQAVLAAVTAARPEVVIHQMTALPRMPNLRKFDQEFAQTNRLRTEGTAHLLAAAKAAGARRFIAQSYTGWPNPRTGSRIKTEEDGLDPTPVPVSANTIAAIGRLESMVMEAANSGSLEAIALRFGSFYGPGTALAPDGEVLEAVRARKLPIVGDGGGVWSFLHIDDAAAATEAVLERGPSGIYNITDDEPAEVSVWLPELARLLGAKPPYHVPAWIARLLIGEAGVSMMTQMRGSSNAKAKRVLGWQPLYASWREGFKTLASASPRAA
jgi:nucleoside-diphosphate-sugar epimerase